MSHRARPPITRRDALCRMGNGFGMMAFASLVSRSLSAAELAQRPKAVAASSEQYINAVYSFNVAKALLARDLGVAEEMARQVLGGVR